MNRRTKQLVFFLLAAVALWLSGCMTPIHTSLDVNKTAEEFDLSYTSQKDVVVERRLVTTQLDGSVVEEYIVLRSEASSAARAQNERDLAAAESRKATAEALKALASRVPIAVPAAVPVLP